MENNGRFGIIKPSVDAHTLGIITISQILEQCGFDVIIGNELISDAVSKISSNQHFGLIQDWILKNRITHLGFSYRLDPYEGADIFCTLVHKIDNSKILLSKNSKLAENIFFAGLKDACDLIGQRFNGRFTTFMGDENITEVLEKLHVPSAKIPETFKQQSQYDKILYGFGNELITQGLHQAPISTNEYHYPAYGQKNDTLIERLSYAHKTGQLPLIRCHIGPYMKKREEALALFSDWLKKLSQSQLLDIVSVGSSQLSQSNFGENWGGKPNGGGIPVNSEIELKAIWSDSLPMLTRSYSGTNNVITVAKVLEKNLNMAWHALSFWWFNHLDGRGPLTLKENLTQHINTLKFIAKIGKPFEPNVPHHFAFRGGDDVTYIAATYIAAKLAKKVGIRFLVLQNMLNTPKYTSGLADLIRSRVLLKTLRTLEDKEFKVIYQPRAGLNYLSPDLEKAKRQLSAVTALMSDVEYNKSDSPEIIHVVSYSEALFLANPEILKESIRITKSTIKHYPNYRELNNIRDFIDNKLMYEKFENLINKVWLLIRDIETNIINPYSENGFYEIFRRGYFPVPFLWGCRDEFPNAINWKTGFIDGSTRVIDKNGKELGIIRRLERIKELNEVKHD